MLSIWHFANETYQLFKHSQAKKRKEAYTTRFDFDVWRKSNSAEMLMYFRYRVSAWSSNFKTNI